MIERGSRGAVKPTAPRWSRTLTEDLRAEYLRVNALEVRYFVRHRGLTGYRSRHRRRPFPPDDSTCGPPRCCCPLRDRICPAPLQRHCSSKLPSSPDNREPWLRVFRTASDCILRCRCCRCGLRFAISGQDRRAQFLISSPAAHEPPASV